MRTSKQVKGEQRLGGYNWSNNNIRKYHESGSGTSINADLILRNWGSINADLRPGAVGPHWAPISQNIGLHLWMRPPQTHGILPIINHDLFWYQKQPKTNLWMTLGLVFNHFLKKHHFGGFSVFYTKYSLIFGDKKIQTQKWCIVEKFWPQKLGVTRFFILKMVCMARQCII